MVNDPQELDDEWLPSAIYLIDNSPKLVDAWNNAFSKIPEVKPVAGDYFQQPADAIVSPANSFGIMDGGLDLAIRDQLGYGVQSRVQTVILDKYHGELPIGCAEIVETDHDKWKYMVAAPTMRIPESIAYTINAYLAFRAILVAIENLNKATGARVIDSLVCSGLGTGVGGMSAEKCSAQMFLAYKTMLFSPVIGRFKSIHEFHRTLHNA